MAPHGEAIPNSFSRSNNFTKPPKLSSNGIQRTISDISFELGKEQILDPKQLAQINEVEDAKCECCGMSEECTPEYIDRVRKKFMGKWICGLCSEAVKEEVAKDGGKKLEEALSVHMNACVKFNKVCRAYPVLFQAEAMREMLKRSKADGRCARAQSISPRDKGSLGQNKGGIARSSSCLAAITRDMNDHLRLVN